MSNKISCITCDHFKFNIKSDKGLCGFSGEVIKRGFSDARYMDMPDDGFCWHSVNMKAQRQRQAANDANKT